MSETIRKTLHFTPATLDRLAPYVRPGEGLSRAAQWKIERLEQIIRDAMPRLPAPVWCFLLAACDVIPPEDTPAGWIIDDIRGQSALAWSYNVDLDWLLHALGRLPYAGLVAVEDAIVRASNLPDELEPVERLRQAGAKAGAFQPRAKDAHV